MLFRSPKITGTPSQLNWLRGASIVAGLELGASFSALGSAQEYSKRGDISSSIAAGIGTGIGLFGGQLSSSFTGKAVKPLTFEEKLKFSQQKLTQMEKEIGKIQQKRFELLRGETGVNKFGVPLKPSAQFDAMALTSSKKITRNEVNILYDYLDDMGLIKNMPKKTFLKDASVSVGRLRTSLPERLGTKGGSLGDLPKVLELGKFSDDLSFVGRGSVEVRELALGIQAKTGKQLKVVYQVNKYGKPIKSTIELQVVTSGKGQKYSIIEPFTKGRASKSVIKTDAGEFILYKESPIRVGEPYTAKTLKSAQAGDDALKIRTSEIEFRQVDSFKKPTSGGTPEDIFLSLQSQKTNKELAALYKKGKKIQTEYLVDVIKKGGTSREAELSLRVGDVGLSGKLNIDKIDDALMLSMLKTKGYSPLGINTKAIDKAFKTSVKPTRVVKGFTTTSDDALKLKLVTSKKDLVKITIPSKPRIITESASKITPKITSKSSKSVTDLFLLSKLPRGIGRGALFQDSLYAGTGQYELTSTTLSPKIDSISGYLISGVQEPQIGIGLSSLGMNLGLGMGSIQQQKQKQILESERKSIKEPLSISKNIQKSLLDIKSLQEIKSSQKLKTKQTSKIEQESRTTQISGTNITKRPGPKPRPPEIIPPKIKPFWFPRRKKKRRLVRRPKTKEIEFLAITKRYGKEKVIAKGKDLTKIISIGKQKVKRTLGATLKVKTIKGKQIKLTPSKIFRVSKTDPLAIVQRKTKRLASPGERREIKKTRKPFSLR